MFYGSAEDGSNEHLQNISRRLYGLNQESDYAELRALRWAASKAWTPTCIIFDCGFTFRLFQRLISGEPLAPQTRYLADWQAVVRAIGVHEPDFFVARRVPSHIRKAHLEDTFAAPSIFSIMKGAIVWPRKRPGNMLSRAAPA